MDMPYTIEQLNEVLMKLNECRMRREKIYEEDLFKAEAFIGTAITQPAKLLQAKLKIDMTKATAK